ncbi:MAG: cytochrome c oxidase assembly protein [Terrimicrobiaceae bacterium]|nr:cytochrome c oxidase assembly protein [Terrimicrobiaceae bacterium]
MSPAESILSSWTFEPLPAVVLLVIALVYFRGWRRLNRQVPGRFPVERLASFLAGLAAIYIALASPLDAFAGWLLTVHMVQHLLLTMVAPPLLLWGWPFLPVLSGLPRPIVREAVAPFLGSPGLGRLASLLVHPVFAGPLFIFSNVFWHVPAVYDLALRDPFWHQIEHIFFLTTATLFWWPVVQPWPWRPVLPRWAMIPYLLIADLQNTALAAFLSFYDGVLYATYEAAPRISNLSALEDQAGAGALMWVPGSIGFLVPAGFIAMQYLSPRRTVRPAAARPVSCEPAPPRKPLDLLDVPVIGALLRWRRLFQFALLLTAIVVIVDGLAGPPVDSMNLAGVLPWTHWRGFTVLALLLAGNVFCYVCPFTFVRDMARRFLPANRRWPAVLSNKWPALVLMVAFFWAYEWFDLWSNPAATAWLILGFFGGALVIDGIFRGASFCKHVCPIGQFHFLSSLASPLEVRVREPSICESCRTHDCLRGNEAARGCELRLFQPRKSGNMDCTFCLDCVQACPHDNVGIRLARPAADLIEDPPRRSSVGAFAARDDLATLAAVFVAGAFVTAAGMTRPVLEWEAALRMFLGPVAGFASAAAFVASILLIPRVTTVGLGAASARLAGSAGLRREITNGFSVALVPLGFSMWVAHFLYHLLTAFFAPWPVVGRFLADRGWSALPESWTVPTLAFAELPGLQILILNVGLLFSLWVLWSKARRIVPGRARRVFAPWAAVAVVLYVLGVAILFAPMDLRGMMM